jgi:hypothetical protein
MSYANVSLKRRSFGETMRRDAWLQPLVVFGLSIFLVYSTWAALQGITIGTIKTAQIPSPLYSPEIRLAAFRPRVSGGHRGCFSPAL